MIVLLLLGTALHGVLDERPERHRWMFTTAAITLATFAARWVLGWQQPRWDPLRVLLAGAVLLIAKAAVIAIWLRLRNPGASRGEVLGDPIDVLLGIVAASLGALLGMSITLYPASALLAVPPMALLDLSGQLPHWRRSALRDAKTGLTNLTHWQRVARSELARARSRAQPAAVLLLDLDHFKRVNDEIGHLARDTVLAAVVLTLRSSVRRGDVVGRFGGEEFVVLLRDADIEVACTVANRVRVSTASLSVPTLDTNGNRRELNNLTVSIGLAASRRFGYELATILGAADAALLAAKSAGRNVVTVA
jgi:diguanylate cyclase (GGDEF)-like protein